MIEMLVILKSSRTYYSCFNDRSRLIQAQLALFVLVTVASANVMDIKAIE